MNITPALLRAATGCTPERAERWAELLGAACAFYGIDTAPRLAAFLAQIGHESGSLRYVEEVWGPTAAQQRYEGRRGLGNTEPGDGYRYRGRGLIQTTGRANYQRLTQRLRARFSDVPDFEGDPDALTDPQWAALSAADYWDMRALNALADADDIVGIGRAINRGNPSATLPANGEPDRLVRWHKARHALTAAPAPGGRRHGDAAPQPQAPDRGPPTAPPPQEEPAMPIPALGLTLLSGLVHAFTPLAREKIEREMARHTDRPEVGQQVADAVLATAQELTGTADPIEAVVAARQDPAVLQQIEARALDEIGKIMPLLERVQAWEMQAHEATEASRRAADERAAGAAHDQDPYLTRAIVRMMVGLMVGGAALAAVLAHLGVNVESIVGALTLAAGAAVREFSGRYQHRYGTSASSAAKDVVIAEVTRRPGGPTR